MDEDVLALIESAELLEIAEDIIVAVFGGEEDGR